MPVHRQKKDATAVQGGSQGDGLSLLTGGARGTQRALFPISLPSCAMASVIRHCRSDFGRFCQPIRHILLPPLLVCCAPLRVI